MFIVKKLYQLVSYNVIDRQALEANRKKLPHHQINQASDPDTFSDPESVIKNSP